MNTISTSSSQPSHRKLIDIPEDVFRALSIKATAMGLNLKKYIEQLLMDEANEMEDAELYRYLASTRPEDAPRIENISNCRKIESLNSVYRIKIGSKRAFFVLHVQIDGETVKFEYLVSHGEAYDKKNMERLRLRDT